MLLSSCKKSDDISNPDDKKCGAANDWSDDVSNNISTYDLSGPTRFLYYENTSTPVNICPSDVPSVNFSVEPKNGIQVAGITTIQGKAYWGLGDNRIITLHWNPIQKVYNGSIDDINFKSFFGDIPAWVGLTIIITMPSQGAALTDEEYIQNNINGMNIDFAYKEF